jgi:hypothetical protein
MAFCLSAFFNAATLSIVSFSWLILDCRETAHSSPWQLMMLHSANLYEKKTSAQMFINTKGY